jgi:hypothetical protein
LPGVIDRHAVHGESELICTKATNRQTTTEQTRRIVVEAVDAGQQGQCLVGVAGRTVFFRGRAGHRAAALRGVFIEDLAGPQLVAFTDDGDGAETHVVVFGAGSAFFIGCSRFGSCLLLGEHRPSRQKGYGKGKRGAGEKGSERLHQKRLQAGTIKKKRPGGLGRADRRRPVGPRALRV